jgi:protein O-GlcNAc transferase
MNSPLQLMLQQAIQAFQSGNFDSADLILKRILQVDPKNFLALNILGLIKASQSKFTEAADYLTRAARIQPNDASIQYNLAKALSDSGNEKDALAHHKKAVSGAPNNSDAWLNYGKTLFNLGEFLEALLKYDKAISLRPDYPEAWVNKGLALCELKRYEEAIADYDKALSLKSDLVEAWTGKGLVLQELNRYEEAIAHYDEALSLRPDSAETWASKGSILRTLKRYQEAIQHYVKALSLRSDLDWLCGDLLDAKMKICRWSDLSDSLESICKKVMANGRVIYPFSLLSLNDNALLHKKSSEIYIQKICPKSLILGVIPKHPKRQKIRIGYFSADFHNHATAYLMAELFELHDKSQFELVGFSFGPIASDEMRQRLEKSFDQFVEVGNKSDIEIAQLSRNLNIDIAIDLKGFTKDARTGIFSHRTAPIQVNYLGYPGTMGADYIDYIIADRSIIPVESQAFYSEKVVCLPGSYQVNDRKRLTSNREFTRQELGLPENGFVFCCFNNNYKILPSSFEGWMRILKAVDGSVLWLFQDNPWAKENLRQEASKHGLDVNRLVFAQRLPLAEHLARHRQADLFLDTFPYNAHTTASDALWAELPVLTMMGKSFASRVAASLLNAIGLPELITNTQEEYEILAIELAKTPQKLAEIKLKLANNRLTTPLFDTPLFAKNLESAYIKMYECYQNDLQPEHILIGSE